MPRVPMSLLLHLLRANGRGRGFVARHRRHGVAGLRRFRRHMRDLRRFRRGGWNRQDLRRHHRNGARPSTQPAPLHPDVPAWLLAGPAAQRPVADGIDPALMAPPPPFWCPEHGWVVCPLHEYGSAAGVDVVRQSPTSVFEFDSTSAAVADASVVAPPFHAVVEMDGHAHAYNSAPTDTPSSEFGSGAGGSRNHTAAPHVAPLVPVVEDWLLAGPAAPEMHVASVVAALPPGNNGSASEMAGVDGAQAGVPASLGFTAVDANTATAPLPSPAPASPPPSSRMGARRRLMALGPPLASPSANSPTSSRGHRAGTWSPAALGLTNGACNGVAPGTVLPGGSEDEDGDERGGSFARRR